MSSNRSQYGAEHLRNSIEKNTKNKNKNTFGLRVLEEVQAGSLTEGVFEYNFQI